MNERIKNFVGIAIVIGALALGYAAVEYSDAFSKSIQPSSFRSFTARGEGKVIAVPDVAQFTFSVITQGGTDIARLLRENTEKVNRAIAFVKSNGVDPKDVKTQGYNLEPRYQYFNCPTPLVFPNRPEPQPCPPPEITGYTITQTVLVKVRDFGKIGETVGGVVDNGANSVSQLSFAVDDESAFESEARNKAIAQAKEKAKEIAKAGGFRVGRLLGIDESGYIPYYGDYFDGRGGGGIAPLAAEKAAPPVIEPGSQEITVNVVLRYEIE